MGINVLFISSLKVSVSPLFVFLAMYGYLLIGFSGNLLGGKRRAKLELVLLVLAVLLIIMLSVFLRSTRPG